MRLSRIALMLAFAALTSVAPVAKAENIAANPSSATVASWTGTNGSANTGSNTSGKPGGLVVMGAGLMCMAGLVRRTKPTS